IFHPAGSYEEPEKTRLDNISDFYEIRMDQRVTASHVSSFRVYLPVKWNHCFMGIAGAGTNTEVDWYSAVRFNVISWPMALKNGYACAVTDNDTGIRLDCSWGFDEKGSLEWDHIDAWAFTTMHQMTECARKIIEAAYFSGIKASYMHGTSGGAREVMTEALLYPGDYDGLWADAPPVDHVNLSFSCIWAAVVEANEKHIVALSKYVKAREIALANPVLRYLPYNSRHAYWQKYIRDLYGTETEDGPITRKDLQVMVKTWDGPVLPDGKKITYGLGPTIRQWPVPGSNPLYGYFQRNPDGKLKLMPIAEQYFRWFVGDPQFDLHTCSYEQFAKIYYGCHRKFDRYSFNQDDFTAFARHGGKLIITQGTGDCVLPYETMLDYYEKVFDHFPSEKMLNSAVRLFMPELAGHSILDWTGPAVSISDGMKALTAWVEEKKAPDYLPTMRYDFAAEKVVEASEVKLYSQWAFRKKLMNLISSHKKDFR
ncbi:MAG: tannase/feruloyl esterase family alpha/beta hydrolase, partial [Eubacterium sp.]|nr:tannase/feruloyl esterase family alpha/beta hydrolase [Eubacterium sp.]